LSFKQENAKHHFAYKTIKQETQWCVPRPILKSYKAKQMDKRWTWTRTKKSQKVFLNVSPLPHDLKQEHVYSQNLNENIITRSEIT
jgi:hypothetical protein